VSVFLIPQRVEVLALLLYYEDMIIDTTQLVVAVVRAVLVTAVLYFFGERLNRFFDTISSKNKTLYKLAQKDKKLRELIVKHYWAVGLLVFVTNILILYLIGN